MVRPLCSAPLYSSYVCILTQSTIFAVVRLAWTLWKRLKRTRDIVPNGMRGLRKSGSEVVASSEPRSLHSRCACRGVISKTLPTTNRDRFGLCRHSLPSLWSHRSFLSIASNKSQ